VVGPVEVTLATAAFNRMQRRIAEHIAERMRIIAAISHDLQTPITSMRLRSELLDVSELKEKLTSDLDAMQSLVQEGIAYARDSQGVTEMPHRTDVDALFDSLVCDYTDTGHAVRLIGRLGRSCTTRPNTLGASSSTCSTMRSNSAGMRKSKSPPAAPILRSWCATAGPAFPKRNSRLSCSRFIDSTVRAIAKRAVRGWGLRSLVNWRQRWAVG